MVALNWEVGPHTSYTYDLVRKKRIRQNQFTETENLEVAIQADTNGKVTVWFEGKTTMPFKLEKDGTPTPRDAHIPLVARFLFMLAGSIGTTYQEGDSYKVWLPTDPELTGLANQVTIQFKNNITVDRVESANGDVLAHLGVVGKQRLLDNPGIRELIGQPSGTAESQAAEMALQSLSGWNHYLEGKVTWSTLRGAPIKAIFVVALVPAKRPTVQKLKTSTLRNELEYTLR